MTEQNKIWQLMARNISGEATNEEIAIFQDFLSQNPAIQQQYEVMRGLWHTSSTHVNNSAENENDIIDRLAISIEDENLALFEQQVRNIKKRRIITWIAVACMAGVGFFLLSVFDFFQPKTVHTAKVIEAPNGSRVKSQLPDGSVVFLNAGSALTFNQFSDSLREVTIIGEGYFDIIRDEKRPFVVHADNIDINVLGTRFTVRSYPGDDAVETTLLHGEVELKRLGDQVPIRIKPNQKIKVTKQSNLEKNQVSGSTNNTMTVFEKSYFISTIDSALKNTDLSETAWIYNRLIFRGDKFDQLARKMERWFNVKIIFTDDQVKSLSFNGSFENETINQALTALQIAEPFKFKINESNEVYISAP